MGPDDCMKYASRCIEIAADATDATARTELLSQAKAWLRLADELNHDHAFRKRVESVDASMPTVGP